MLTEVETERWQELLRVPAMSAGLYVLPAGGVDTQQPHGEDEVYVVLAGAATLEVEGERHAAVPGALLFVAAGADHRFVEITEDLRVLVVFAPAETA